MLILTPKNYLNTPRRTRPSNECRSEESTAIPHILNLGYFLHLLDKIGRFFKAHESLLCKKNSNLIIINNENLVKLPKNIKM